MAVLTFEGGLNEQDNTLVNPSECVSGYNFELGSRDTHFKPRPAFDLAGTTTNAAQINGIVQLIKNDNSETTLIQSGTTVYSWDGQTTFTSKGTTTSADTRHRGVSWELGGYSVITDLAKLTVMKKWDGTTYGNLTTGLGVALYAKYPLVHLGRVWLFNVKAGTDTPHLLVASAFENPESYDTSKRAQDSSFTTGNEAFYMTMPDLKPINGVALFYGTLIISTYKGSLWKLTGTDSTDFAIVPFYSGSASVGDEALANIGDDVTFMRNNGVIELLSSTEKFGDTKTDDISRWIQTTTSELSESIIVYDQSRQKVYYFCGANKLLVLFKDMLNTNLSPWSVYRTSHSFAFQTETAVYIRQPGGTASSGWFVYVGDSSGNIYKMDGEGSGDPSDTDIETYRKSKFFEELEREDGSFWNPEIDALRGRVFYRRVADCDLLIDFDWADDYSNPVCTVPLEGPSLTDGAVYWGGSGYWGGSFYWNTGFLVSQRPSTKGFSGVGRGPGFHVGLTIQSSQQFDIIKIEL